MKDTAIKSQFDKMVKDTSSEGTQAQRESGGGTYGTGDEEEEGEEENDDDDEEKKTKRDLVSEQKHVGESIVDLASGLSFDHAAGIQRGVVGLF